MAVACCQWHLDAEALCAALLHDTIEDCGVCSDQISQLFGPAVARLVDGLTKLDQIAFRNREEAQAESFRKMLLAMADDVRVILIKLADRLHNMRTLGVVSPAKRRRIAQETLEIYAPIAHRLGLNEVFREFEDLCFAGLYPNRHLVLSKALKASRGNRKEIVTKLLAAVREQLPRFDLVAEVSGREKSIYSVYTKMREKGLSFAEVLDIYGFRVLVDSVSDCYVAMGAIHALFSPSPGRFKDYIALPKSNGYQSLHTVVIGPQGTPLEFQIRTHEMHQLAEAGVAAHWLYKEADENVTPLQRKAHEWMQTLISTQTQDPSEFFEHVKIELFPDVVYVLTPKGEIKELPRGSTPVDFAYSVHSDVGNRMVGALINGEARPLDTELHSGDTVRIETRPHATPHPGWLGFVRTARARSEIRHTLKSGTRERSIGFGQRLLEHAVRALGAEGLHDPGLQWSQLFHENAADSPEALYESIGLGHTLAHVAARRLVPLVSMGHERPLSDAAKAALALSVAHLTTPESSLTIHGNEGPAVQYAPCCYPIGGDKAVGNMRGGSGLMIHRASCPTARRQRSKDAARWTDIAWSDNLMRSFETRLVIEVADGAGVLAKVASAISSADANIVDLTIQPRGTGFAFLQVAVEVRDRKHLADVLRQVRASAVVSKAVRLTRSTVPPPSSSQPRPSL